MAREECICTECGERVENAAVGGMSYADYCVDGVWARLAHALKRCGYGAQAVEPKVRVVRSRKSDS
jgi:hypothetical protein